MKQPRVIVEDWTPFLSGLLINLTYENDKLKAIVGYRNRKILSECKFHYDGDHITQVEAFSEKFHIALDEKRHFTSGAAQFNYVWEGNRVVASDGQMEIQPLGSVREKAEKFEFNRQFSYGEDGRLAVAMQEGEEAYTLKKEGDKMIETESGIQTTYIYKDKLLREIREVIVDRKGPPVRRTLFEYIETGCLARVLEERPNAGCYIKELHHYEPVIAHSLSDNIQHHFWTEHNGKWLLTCKLHAHPEPSAGGPIELPIADVNESIGILDKLGLHAEYYRMDPHSRIANSVVRSTDRYYLHQQIRWGAGECWRLDKVVNNAKAYGWGLSRGGTGPIFMEDYAQSWAPWQEVNMK